jgi:lambda repressor-like predicted transcriptional regulator
MNLPTRLHRDAAVYLHRLDAEQRHLARLHAAGVTLATLARMSGRSVESLSRLLRGDWRS